jgi:hypothetical protein
LNRWQQEADQNADEANDHQQLDQGETASSEKSSPGRIAQANESNGHDTTRKYERKL